MAYLGGHSVVIGGSIAGLVTARVLSDYFDQVTVVERDYIEDAPRIHKSIPQGNHVHALLLGGKEVLSSLYPGFVDQLERMGALGGTQDLVVYHPSGKSYSLTGSLKEPRDYGWKVYTQSRGLLEHCVRHCTLKLPNIRFESETNVTSLIHDRGDVRGVRYDHHGAAASLDADLVVDTGGRGSHALRWFSELGYRRPEETLIGCDFAYSSARFRIPGYDGEPEHRLFFYGPPPTYPSASIMWKIEDNLWHVSLGGRFGDYPPGDHDGFLAFARSLWTPRLYDLLKDAERVTEISQHRYPNSLWRHYENLAEYPGRFILLGDAISSFNPIYGQGMSSAALQVQELQRLLAVRSVESRGLEGLGAEFFPRAAEVIKTPWTLAAANDLAYPKTTGQRPANFAESGAYFAALDALTVDDFEVGRLVTQVFQLAKPLSALTEEPLRSRVLANMRSGS